VPHRPVNAAVLGPRAVPAIVLFALVLFGALPALDAAAGRARDNDRDGLSNKSEKKYKTNWRRRDTDGDRLGDGAEVFKYRTDPLRKDTDRDRVKDGKEVLKYRTNPRRADTDRDGASDWREIRRLRTNPRRKDTDGDGLLDGPEWRKYKTNPRRADTDSDGIPDGLEVLRGLNPLVKNGAAAPSPAPSPSPSPAPPAGSSGPSSGPPAQACTSVVSSLAAVQSAIAAAAPGAVVCLTDGSYGRLTLNASKPAPGVTVRAQNPGGATIQGGLVNGAYLTISRFNSVADEIRVDAGASHIEISWNRFSGGYFGINAGLTTSYPSINDITIRGNRFVGPFGEDAIRINHYHDGPDADPYGMLVEGNELTNIRENGNHSDCLQSVWGGDGLYFRRNYLHDNNCQGFFVKDQPSPVVNVVAEDNLFIRNDGRCAPPLQPNCGTPAYFQVFGPITNFAMRRNTIWSPEQEDSTVLQENGWSGAIVVQNNVIYRAFSSTTSPFGSGYQSSGNIGCADNGRNPTEKFWPRTGFALNCRPAFPNPAGGDYRLGGAGVTWKVSDLHFGP
jgi:Bacterial TSP3 repeat